MQFLFCLRRKHKCVCTTSTPAATDAMAFLLSPQSTLHSQSPHRIPSRNPDMAVGESVSKRFAVFPVRRHSDLCLRANRAALSCWYSTLLLLRTALSETKTIFSSDFNSSRLSNPETKGLCHSHVTKAFSRWTKVCRRTLLFIALVLANISLKDSDCDEGKKQNNSNDNCGIRPKKARWRWWSTAKSLLKEYFTFSLWFLMRTPWIKPDLASEELSHAHAHLLPTRSRWKPPRRCAKWCL